jgi:hypothetical protein
LGEERDHAASRKAGLGIAGAQGGGSSSGDGRRGNGTTSADKGPIELVNLRGAASGPASWAGPMELCEGEESVSESVNEDLPPDPAIEFAVAVVMAYASVLRRRERMAFLAILEGVFEAFAEDISVQAVRTRHRAALRVAREEARGWFELYLPTFMNGA